MMNRKTTQISFLVAVVLCLVAVTYVALILTPTTVPVFLQVNDTSHESNQTTSSVITASQATTEVRRGKLKDFYSGCNWTDGSWVKDTSIVYGRGYLSGYSTCASNRGFRFNSSNLPHIGYRWVLRNERCEVKRIRFTRQRFLEIIQNKKVLFVGDSLSRNMFDSLACLLYVPNNKSMMIAQTRRRYRYPDYKATIELVSSQFLVKQSRSDCPGNATSALPWGGKRCIDVKTVDSVWANRIKEHDIFIFSTGAWWEGHLEREQTSSGDKKNRKYKEIFRQSLATVMNYLGRPVFKNKQIFWRCSEVSHFFGGKWNTGGTCQRDTPSNFSQYNAASLIIQEAVMDSLDATAANISLLDITRMSSYRQDAHPSSQSHTRRKTDCKHWGLPGVPDHWNEIWLNMLNVKYSGRN